MYKSCCFFGHRKIIVSEILKIKLENIILKLISNGVDTFIFGSQSDFDCLCYNIVSDLKEKYPHINRINYYLPNERVFTSKESAQKVEKLHLQTLNEKTKYDYYEKAILCENVLSATKNRYIVRNYEMINASDICIFYYDKDYLPPKRKHSKKSYTEYQPKSGTSIAYTYAKQKKKEIINLFYN